MGISVADRVEYTGAPEIGPKIDPGGGYNISASPDSFGASMFTAIHKLGQTGSDAVIQKQELVNNLDHDSRALDTSKKFSDAWSDYGQLEGDAAIKGLPAYQKRLKDIYNEAVQNAPNDDVRKQLAQTMFRDADRYMSHGANYADTQLRHWHDKVHKDAIENNIDQTVLHRKQPISDLDDIIEHGSNGVGGANSVREKMLHKFAPDADLEDPKTKSAIEGEVAKYRGAAVVPLVKELADEGDLNKAKEVFDHFKDRMDSKSVVAIEGFLRPKLLEAKTAEIADREKPIPGEGFPTDAAEQRRLTIGQAAPTRAASAALAGRAGEATAAGARHPSDFFVKLERGNANIDYINKKDTDGSHAYGSMGVSSRGGVGSSADRFAQANPLLGLTGEPGSMEFDRSWEKAAHEHPNELRAAEKKWWEDHYLNPVPGKLKDAGIPSSIADDRLVQFYMADRLDQYGEHILDRRTGNPHQVTHIERMQEAAIRADGDPKKFLSFVRASDEAHLRGDFGKAIDTGAYSAASHQERLNGRMAAAQQALAAESGTPATTAGAQPGQPLDSVISPGYSTREAHRQSNLVRSHALSGGDTQLEHKLYSEFNRRDILLKENLSGERQRIDGIMRDFDLQASKGKAGITLESMGISEDQIRAAHADKPWKAEQIIEQARMQEDVANHLSSLKFASHDEISNYVYGLQAGLGIDAMTEKYRKGHGTEGAFVSADPAEVVSGNFALQEKLAKTGRDFLSKYQDIMNNNPAQWAITEKHPAIMKAFEAVNNAKTPEESAKAFRDYASAQVSFQREAGVPEKDIHILTATAAEKQADHIINSKDPKGVMDQLSKQYGGLWNGIFHDVVKLGKLPATYEATQYIDDENARILSRMAKQEYDAAQEAEKNKKNPRAMEERLGLAPDGHPNKKLVDTAIDNDRTYQDMRLSFERRGVNMDTRWPEIEKSIKTLAYGRVSGAGMGDREDPGTASRKSIDAFMANYTMTRDMAMLPKANATEIQQIMGFVKESLTNKDTHVPGWTAQAKRTGTPDEDRYLFQAKANGMWVNTPNGDGVEYRDHTNRPMKYKDGNPVRIMFSNLGDARNRMKQALYFEEQSAPPGGP
jgi:hypothetical protein